MLRSVDPVFDVAIVGGGLAGLALSHALASSGMRPVVIERDVAGGGGEGARSDFDARAIALSFGASRILANIGDGTGLWPTVERTATPILNVHVSEQGRFGRVHLAADELGVPALGYVTDGAAAGRALLESVRQRQEVTLLSEAKVAGLSVGRGGVRLSVIERDRSVSVDARVVVAADGGRSTVRALIGVPVRARDYASRAVIANITVSREHGGTAYERFTRFGPMALLPIDRAGFGLVWTAGVARADELLALDDVEFLGALRSTFGARVGNFLRVGTRASFPLHRVSAARMQHPRVVLIGNAANHLHPVAGQGFNLGLRDVAVLREHLVEAHRAGEDPGSAAVISGYVAARERDQRRTVGFTDSLASLFVADWPLLPTARNIAMLALDAAPHMRRAFGHQAMGIRPQQVLRTGRAAVT